MDAACDRIDPLLTRWADGTLARAEREAVDAHLAGCARCRAAAVREDAIHGLLRSRATTLRDEAPADLRQRVLRQRDATRGAAPAATADTAPRRSLWRLPLAAGVALGLLSASMVAALAPRGTVLAAELAFDHLKCHLIATPQANADPVALEQRWRQHQGWDLDVPPDGRVGGLELSGLRRCLFHGGRMAHISYTWRGQPVSLFVLREPGQRSASLEIMGVATTTWVEGGHTYALTGDLSDAELQVLAAALRRR